MNNNNGTVILKLIPRLYKNNIVSNKRPESKLFNPHDYNKDDI